MEEEKLGEPVAREVAAAADLEEEIENAVGGPPATAPTTPPMTPVGESPGSESRLKRGFQTVVGWFSPSSPQKKPSESVAAQMPPGARKARAIPSLDGVTVKRRSG